ncbi:hypothetical protein XENTR_v10000042 [Xenopus tropicalis]|nr:hypothetical protein XENTR_v10000042 [Xenopus tropicalis]
MGIPCYWLMSKEDKQKLMTVPVYPLLSPYLLAVQPCFALSKACSTTAAVTSFIIPSPESNNMAAYNYQTVIGQTLLCSAPRYRAQTGTTGGSIPVTAPTHKATYLVVIIPHPSALPMCLLAMEVVHIL